MKKILLALLLAITFMACEGPEGAMGPMGPAGKPGEPGYNTDWFTKVITIDKSEWQLYGEPNALDSYYYVDKQILELTDLIYKEGTVLAYIENEKNIKNGLPFVRHYGDADDKGEFFWTETVDFDYYKGGMSFRISYSDFNTVVEPGTKIFHIVFMW